MRSCKAVFICWPNNSIRPESGSVIFTIMRIVVVLPAPFGPMRPKTRPIRMCRRYPRRNYPANINLLRHLSKERRLINSGFKFDGNVEKAASLQRSEMFIDTGSLKHLAPLGAKHRKVLVDQPKHRAPTE